MIDFDGRMTKNNLREFADYINGLQSRIGFKISARGWCYQLEQSRLINKDQFDKVESWINRCRRDGILPIDFTAEESSRAFEGVEEPQSQSPVDYFLSTLDAVLDVGKWYTPNWWQNEQYYIQMIVEKIDLVTLFYPICHKYHIPIANTKGWSSMNQRAEYARRFAEAQAKGLECVLLYCGDHDPDGLRISDFLRSNLYDLRKVKWTDGTRGYNPDRLIIERFGLDYDFIEKNGLVWIDNLITGSGKDLASPKHKNHYLPYLQDYLSLYGARKCESNALVVIPEVAREFVEGVILNYLGDDVLDRFDELRQEVIREVDTFKTESGLSDWIAENL